jgi:capsular exopolysaccharide synthesis family protein
MERKISNLNDDFDIKLFFKVARNNAAWIILFFIIAFLMAFLYLRYTYPIYEANAIIQVTKADNGSKVIMENEFFKSDIPSKIELLRSSTFLGRVFNKLPLDVSYYQIGNVLNYEMYKTSPFTIEYRNPNPNAFNIPIYISFTDENNAGFTINLDNREGFFPVKTNTWSSTPIADSIKVVINNYEKIRNEMRGAEDRVYYFVLSKRENLVRAYSPSLEVKLLNEAAGTIAIKFYERNPSKASDICNSISEEFKVYDIEKQAEGANNTITFVNDQLKIIYDQLYASELELQNFKTENRLEDELPLPEFSLRINELQKMLADLEMEESSLNTIESAIKQDFTLDIYKLISITAGSTIESALNDNLKRLRDLLTRREIGLYSKTNNSSTIAQLDYQIEIEKKLIIEIIATSKQRIQEQIVQIEQRVLSYEDDIKNNALRFDRLEFIRLAKLNSINERYYNRLVELKSELSIANAGITSMNTVLETSSTPASPFFPSRRVVATSAIIGWLLTSLGLIVLRYLFYNEITSMNEIVKFIDVPMLGIVPNYKDSIPISQLLVDKKPKSLIAESLRSIRSNLEFLSTTEGSKMLAITSTISGEGKTFVAMNLAGIIAFSEKKVIILDLDMRKPKIHVGFGVPNDKGMSTILINRNTIEECIYQSSLVNLDFITAGPVPPNPSELIISARMLEVVNELKTKYDLIVIDNPPVGLVTDGIRIIKMADYPVYVFRENYSKRNFVQNVRKLIRDNNIKNLSIILNSVDIKRSGYGYSGVYDYDYGYGYGYGFGYYDEDIRRDKFNIKEFLRRLISK